MPKLSKIIEYLFYLFIFLLPWQTRWIWHYGKLGEGISQYLTFSLYATEIILFVILVLAVIYKIKDKDEEFGIINYRLFDFYILFFLWLAISFVSIFTAADSLVAWYFFIKILEGLALLILVINLKFSYLNAAGALVLSGLLQAILAISQFITQKVWASKWLGMAEQARATAGVSVVEVNGDRWLRAYGAFTHPNVLAGFLVICALLLVVLIIFSRHKWEKILLWAAWPIILAGLFFTFSKSAFLAFLIGLIFISLFIFIGPDKNVKIKISQLIFLAIFVLGLLTLFYSDLVFTRLNGTGRLEEKSVSERILTATQAKDLIQQNWLTGVGLGNYTLYLYNNDSAKAAAWAYQPVHNYFLLVASELGVFGFVIFIFLLVQILRKIWHYQIDKNLQLMKILKLFKIAEIYQAYQHNFYWFIGLTGIIIAVLVLMIFDHYFWTQWFGIALWWMCLALWLKQVGLVK